MAPAFIALTGIEIFATFCDEDDRRTSLNLRGFRPE